MLVVVPQTSVQDERSPLVLQLQIDVAVLFPSLTCFTYQRVFRECPLKPIARLVAKVIDREIIVLGTESDVSFMAVAQVIGVTALQLEAIVLFLSIDVTRYASLMGYDRIDGRWQANGLPKSWHRQIVQHLIACDVHLVVSDGILQVQITDAVAVAQVGMMGIVAEAGLQAIVGTVALAVVAESQRCQGEGSYEL